MVPSEIVGQELRGHDPDERLLSIAEWAALPEDESGELVDGRLVEEEVPDVVHEIVVTWLVWTFRSWLADRGGFVIGSEAKFAVAARRGRKPDVSVYVPGGAVPEARGAVYTPPDLAVEIVSPTPRDARRDRVEKVSDYATFGIRFYWIVDPVERTVELLELGADGRYVRALAAGEGRLSTIPGCDGLVLDLDALWTEIDRLGLPAADEGPQG